MKILITSALPYINGVKHLGNLVGSILPSDVFARFKRQRGDEVLFICATDEHGTPAELAALNAGQDVADFCREQYEVQRDIYERFHIDFDYFGRSSSPDNHELTQHFARKLDENGFIEEREINQVYSLDDARYLPDRYVEGECPNCGYEKARGDQCESCTKLLDPTDLINPRSAVSGGTNIEIRATKHLFLRQSALIGEVEEWIDTHQDWAHLVTSIAKKWIKEGVRDRCITRDLKWGVPVDRPGFEGKVFYVWFDAPIAYISTTKSWGEEDPDNRDWKAWWTEGNDVTYYQFMAKDNIPFHTISFPATQIGSREPWKKVDELKGFNWLTYYGGKFSTSSKRGIFTDQALAEEPADYWRYWLMANAPESGDSIFTIQRFADQCNKDLAHTLGNFINRGTKFCEKQFGTVVPTGGDWTQEEHAMAKELQGLIDDYTAHMEAVDFRKALTSLRAIWSLGNNYLASAAPWTAIKTDRDRAACIIRTGLNLTRLFAVLAWSIIPDSAEKILTAIGEAPTPGIAPPWPTQDIQAELSTLEPGRPFTVLPPLFKVLDEERVQQLTETYGGAPDEGGAEG